MFQTEANGFVAKPSGCDRGFGNSGTKLNIWESKKLKLIQEDGDRGGDVSSETVMGFDVVSI